MKYRDIFVARAFAVSLGHLTGILLRHYERLAIRIQLQPGYMFCKTKTNLYMGFLRS